MLNDRESEGARLAPEPQQINDYRTFRNAPTFANRIFSPCIHQRQRLYAFYLFPLCYTDPARIADHPPTAESIINSTLSVISLLL